MQPDAFAGGEFFVEGVADEGVGKAIAPGAPRDGRDETRGDGFLQDLRHLCAASGVGAVVECSSLPLGKAARALPDGMELALTGGEDYALLLAMPQRALSRYRGRFKVVGRITRGREIVLTELGQPRPLPRIAGFDHLK